MIISFDARAEPGEIFAQGAFDKAVGSEITVKGYQAEAVIGRLTQARVSPSGRTVQLVIKVQDANAH